MWPSKKFRDSGDLLSWALWMRASYGGMSCDVNLCLIIAELDGDRFEDHMIKRRWRRQCVDYDDWSCFFLLYFCHPSLLGCKIHIFPRYELEKGPRAVYATVREII